MYRQSFSEYFYQVLKKLSFADAAFNAVKTIKEIRFTNCVNQVRPTAATAVFGTR